MPLPDRAAQASLLLTAAYILLQLVLLLQATGGHFVYALDDPYIHLDLARQFALTGIYGVNPGEYAAPSSSILWPFLLAPFAATPFFVYVPFVIGLLCAALSATVICSLLPRGMNTASRTGITLLAVLALNLPGLAFIGMEHGLHVLMSLLAAKACLDMLSGKKPPRWLWVLVIAEPLLRYEGVLISAAVLGIAFWTGHRRQAIITGLLMALPVAGFSLFLHAHDLGILPGSTIVKKLRLGDVHGGFWKMWGRSLQVGLASPSGVILVVLSLFSPLGPLLLRREWRSPRFAAALAVCGTLLGHLLLGRLSTWESPRYDLYASAFVVPLILWLLAGSAQTLLARTAALLMLAFLALPGTYASLWGFRPAALAVYQQQYQMMRLVRDYWHDSLAVNDIGLAGLGTDAYVLDLVGLANPEVLQSWEQQLPDWPNRIIRSKGIPLIIIYRSWFDAATRASWTPVGELFRATPTSMGDSSVLFLTPYPERVADIHKALKAWAQSLPEGSRYVEYNETHPTPDDAEALRLGQ